MVARVAPGNARIAGRSSPSRRRRRIQRSGSSGSSSCLLLPKEEQEPNELSPSQQQQQQQQQQDATTNGECNDKQQQLQLQLQQADEEEEEEEEEGPLSVTLLSTEQLPSYSTERFYLLSELEMNANSTHFLLEEQNNPGDELFWVGEAGQQQQQQQQQGNNFPPPYCILYLLWKPDHNNSSTTTTTDSSDSDSDNSDSAARAFVEKTVVQYVTKLEKENNGGVRIIPISTNTSNNGTSGRDIVISPSLSMDTMSSTMSSDDDEDEDDDDEEIILQEEEDGESQAQTRPGSKGTSPQELKATDATNNNDRQQSSSMATVATTSASTNLYVVVDRVEPISDSSSQSSQSQLFKQQEKLAHQLAKQIASHPRLRSICNGVLVGVSNHERAAPGLEACVDAVLVGSSQRRQFGTGGSSHNNKSLIGIVSPSRDCMLGINLQAETDAVQGVLQSRIVAEWNGLGNLQSFAKRSHAAWRQRCGLPPQREPPQLRKIPKRIRKPPPPPSSPPPPQSNMISRAVQGKAKLPSQGISRDTQELLYDLLAAIIIIGYVTFHFRHELENILMWLVSHPVSAFQVDLVQILRELGSRTARRK